MASIFPSGFWIFFAKENSCPEMSSNGSIRTEIDRFESLNIEIFYFILYCNRISSIREAFKIYNFYVFCKSSLIILSIHDFASKVLRIFRSTCAPLL